ncbi:hypothetical protein M434DRAFT_29109 [Hypoxylon sp. CO27-5]|nr:hypothetical protein M434DRAFT_29109 [Hypoxylon sp. CO27-5]
MEKALSSEPSPHVLRCLFVPCSTATGYLADNDSISKTSKAAPRIRPFPNAPYNAASSINGPLDTLTSTADLFIKANSPAPTRPLAKHLMRIHHVRRREHLVHIYSRPQKSALRDPRDGRRTPEAPPPPPFGPSAFSCVKFSL